MIANRLLIGGELVSAPDTLEVVDPATGSPFTAVPLATATDVEASVQAAQAAQPAWAGQPLERRQAALAALADAVHRHAAELAEAIVREQGKPLAEAAAETASAERALRYVAMQDLPVETVADPVAEIEIDHVPLGTVAGIVPWNFPLFSAVAKLAPAVLMGNAFILKPAPTTPTSALMLAALARPLFPAGIVNVLTDAGAVGPLLTSHTGIAKIAFTGSVAVGKAVMRNAAQDLKRLTLELGGNDAAIVVGPVDVEDVAGKLFASAFVNCGQVCTAVKRVYVPAGIYDELVAALSRLADAAAVGPGLAPATRMGPLHSCAQLDKAERFLAIARRDGVVAAGGAILDQPGYFVRPTIVRDIAADSPLVAEEQFVPVLPVVAYESSEAAVAAVNGSPFGLGASVWSSDPELARRTARKIMTGTVWINHHRHTGPHIPFGGARQSGIGSEFGRSGLMEYGQRRVINRARQP